MPGYHQPRQLDTALDLLRGRPEMVVLAGATDVYPARASRAGWGRFRHADVLDISRLDELRGIREADDHWWIGALTTWHEIAEAPLPPLFDGLRMAARAIGGAQVQSRATIGGNICTASPAGDSIPCLLALDAEVVVALSNSQFGGASPVAPSTPRRDVGESQGGLDSRAPTIGIPPTPNPSPQGGGGSLSLPDFFTGYRATRVSGGRGLVTGLRIPKRSAAGHFVKLGARSHLVISIAMVAGTLEADHSNRIAAARIAVGACSAVAQRLSLLERDLVGQSLDSDLAASIDEHHFATLEPIDDIRADAAYRRAAALTATRDLVRELARRTMRRPA